MAWQCPKCKKLQHYTSICKFCGYKNKTKVTKKDLIKLKSFKMPENYWTKKKKIPKKKKGRKAFVLIELDNDLKKYLERKRK